MLQEAMIKVKEAEVQAEEIIKEAKANGAKLIEDARQQAKLLLDQTKENALAEANQRLEAAKAVSAVEKQEYASRLGTELQQTTADVLQQKDAAVAAIVETLL